MPRHLSNGPYERAYLKRQITPVCVRSRLCIRSCWSCWSRETTLLHWLLISTLWLLLETLWLSEALLLHWLLVATLWLSKTLLHWLLRISTHWLSVTLLSSHTVVRLSTESTNIVEPTSVILVSIDVEENCQCLTNLNVESLQSVNTENIEDALARIVSRNLYYV